MGTLKSRHCRLTRQEALLPPASLNGEMLLKHLPSPFSKTHSRWKELLPRTHSGRSCRWVCSGEGSGDRCLEDRAPYCSLSSLLRPWGQNRSADQLEGSIHGKHPWEEKEGSGKGSLRGFSEHGEDCAQICGSTFFFQRVCDSVSKVTSGPGCKVIDSFSCRPLIMSTVMKESVCLSFFYPWVWTSASRAAHGPCIGHFSQPQQQEPESQNMQDGDPSRNRRFPLPHHCFPMRRSLL